jgi:TatD DNase family protein
LLSDTHCHLYFDAFDHDRDQALDRAREAGVGRILAPGIDLQSSADAVTLAAENPEIYAAAGIHPNEAQQWDEQVEEQLAALASQQKVVAIGEIGLDYYRERAPVELQRDIFSRQLTLAATLDLPVVVHTRNRGETDRRAMADALAILREWQAGLLATKPFRAANPGVLHAFSGNAADARAAIEMGFVIGIPGTVTFRNATGLQQLLGDLPMDHVLVETDAPFLTPHPFRGKRNEPAYVRFVAEKVAEIRKLPVELVAEITGQNAERLFHW